MNDLKLYAKNEGLLMTVNRFSDDREMQFGRKREYVRKTYGRRVLVKSKNITLEITEL